MAIQNERVMTVAEYLEWEERQEVKHEYIDGEIIDMSGGTGEHSIIIGNIQGLLWSLLSFPQYTVHTSEMRVKFSPTRYVYPDLSVVRGESIYDDGSRLNLLNPVFVVEVTSPSSAMRDRVDKLELYFAVPSIAAYLIVDQDRPRADLYTRSKEGWHLQIFNNAEDVIPLPMLDCQLPLAQVYRGIEFAVAEH
ncbi:MAG: Uma2 family endonuclease [Chloroflexota bacterium]|nr:Uma2 family endonuclease [Chloroflexota bacterium]MDE2909691.1 Uma2 family endonuclease [Chloroflexota bacterium]